MIRQNFTPKSIILIVLITTALLNFQGQVIIDERFNNGVKAPDGWTINAGGLYTSDAGSGDSIPAIKLSTMGNFIETPYFKGANECSFWIKGYSTDMASALIISVMTDSTWNVIDTLANIPHSEKIIELTIPENSVKLKISYLKSAGNVAFDDLIIRTSTLPVFTPNSPEITYKTDSSVRFDISTDKRSIVYYIINASGNMPPEIEDFFSLEQDSGFNTICAGSLVLSDMTDTFIIVNHLKENTHYVSYWLVCNANHEMSIFGSTGSVDFSTYEKNSDLFFSEIDKGSGNNKAIEIFNPTKEKISLANYRIAISSNGSGWKTSYYYFPSEACIAPNDVYVILKNTADTNVVNPEVADHLSSSSVLGFTGNDARGLQKTDIYSKNWITIDLYGDPVSASDFDVAGIEGACANHTLLRKSVIRHGNPEWSISAGTSLQNSEWIVTDANDFSNLGVHQVWKEGENLCFDTIYFEEQKFTADVDVVNHSILFTLPEKTQLSEMVLRYELPSGVKISPNPDTIHDFSNPVFINLISSDSSIQTTWEIKTKLDSAPTVRNIEYINAAINVVFNEPILFYENNYSAVNNPGIFIYQQTNPNTMIPYEAYYADSTNCLKIIPEEQLNESVPYNLCIDSVRDVFNNVMPRFSWTFTATYVNDMSLEKNNSNIRIWPNPCTKYVFLDIPSDPGNSLVFADLLSSNGQKIFTFCFIHSPIVKIELPEVSGVYILKITSKNYSNSFLLNIK